MSGFLPVEALSALSQQAQSMVATANAQSLQGPASATAPGASAEPVIGSFGQLVSDGLSKVNGQLIGSQVDLQKLAMGDAQSRVSFQLMMQVRSRLLEAYQDVMKMPI
jgi:flagellar hook-basal body complex protein FliE